MSTADDKLDEFGKQALSSLRATPPLDPRAASEIKKAYLMQAETLRQSAIPASGKASSKRGIFWYFQQKPLLKVMAAAF
jgi:hypothetical protein